jgi:hypothetical protein
VGRRAPLESSDPSPSDPSPTEEKS